MGIETNSDMRLVTDQDMKIWERRTPWPRAFFVDNVAFYQTNELADFVRNAPGGLLRTRFIAPIEKRTVCSS